MYNPRLEPRLKHIEKLLEFLARKAGMSECPHCKSTGLHERLFEEIRPCDNCLGLGWMGYIPDK